MNELKGPGTAVSLVGRLALAILLTAGCAAGHREDEAARVASYWARLDRVNHDLQAALETPFPDLRLFDRNGTPTSLSAVRKGPIALFYAGGPCPGSATWADELRAAAWRYRDLPVVSLVKTTGFPKLNERLAGSEVYLTDWPLPDFLASNTFYPILYVLDDTGRFVAYKWQDKPLVTKSSELPSGGN